MYQTGNADRHYAGPIKLDKTDKALSWDAQAEYARKKGGRLLT